MSTPAASSAKWGDATEDTPVERLATTTPATAGATPAAAAATATAVEKVAEKLAEVKVETKETKDEEEDEEGKFDEIAHQCIGSEHIYYIM